MADFSLSIAGGDKLQATLEKLARRLGSGGVVNTGFLESATYPAKPDQPALNVASVAFFNEFGTSNAPPRPFFRQMVAAKSPGWGRALGAAAKSVDYDSAQTLNIMGEVIKGELRESITQFTTPALKPSTIARKGFDKPLVDTGHMLASVDYEVKA